MGYLLQLFMPCVFLIATGNAYQMGTGSQDYNSVSPNQAPVGASYQNPQPTYNQQQNRSSDSYPLPSSPTQYPPKSAYNTANSRPTPAAASYPYKPSSALYVDSSYPAAQGPPPHYPAPQAPPNYYSQPTTEAPHSGFWNFLNVFSWPRIELGLPFFSSGTDQATSPPNYRYPLPPSGGNLYGQAPQQQSMSNYPMYNPIYNPPPASNYPSRPATTHPHGLYQVPAPNSKVPGYYPLPGPPAYPTSTSSKPGYASPTTPTYTTKTPTYPTPSPTTAMPSYEPRKPSPNNYYYGAPNKVPQPDYSAVQPAYSIYLVPAKPIYTSPPSVANFPSGYAPATSQQDTQYAQYANAYRPQQQQYKPLPQGPAAPAPLPSYPNYYSDYGYPQLGSQYNPRPSMQVPYPVADSLMSQSQSEVAYSGGHSSQKADCKNDTVTTTTASTDETDPTTVVTPQQPPSDPTTAPTTTPVLPTDPPKTTQASTTTSATTSSTYSTTSATGGPQARLLLRENDLNEWAPLTIS